jgi:hypothetical protein
MTSSQRLKVVNVVARNVGMAPLLDRSVAQPCIACPTLVTTFHQWFQQVCPTNWEGHEVKDWTALKFNDDITDGQEAPSTARGSR